MLDHRGNPATQIGNYKPVPMPQKRVRALTADWYVGAGGQVAVEGKTYNVDADVARALVQQGRAEYVA